MAFATTIAKRVSLIAGVSALWDNVTSSTQTPPSIAPLCLRHSGGVFMQFKQLALTAALATTV